ncbi:MAG: phosphatidate cytidylyltransferase [Ruminococcaceae bacterium]|nr:phosphatidate cytidylyltransferase [Oscillospiraceae bacterium]
MLTRILTAIVALLLLIPLLIFGGEWGASALFAVICGFSMYEMLVCCGLIKKHYISVPAIIASMLLTLIPIILFPHTYLVVGSSLAAIPLLLVCFLILAVIAHKSVDIERLLMFFSLALYITAGFAVLTLLRAFYGLWAVAFVLLISWCTDTFAYFSGMLFGKKKLCPEISPKKTIAGAVGGTLFGTAAGVIVLWIAIDKPLLGIIALPLSIISQFGDLAASVIKRRFGVKDYGKIFPGHGGVLDRFDSIIPVSIVTGLIFCAIDTISWL